MEHRLLSGFNPERQFSDKSSASAISLISNSFTSDLTISSIVEALNLYLQNHDHCHHQIISLLSAAAFHHPQLRHLIMTAAQKFILLPSTPITSIPCALSLLNLDDSTSSDESLFLSLCFGQCVKVRRWTLRNVTKFRVRPSVLLMVILGFTKDPYPYVREAALCGLVLLSNGISVDDLSLIEGCYFRAVELLFDMENSVRLAAVQTVSKLGQLLVALNSDDFRRDWSDALFIQLCLMTRDMDMEIRAAAFTALGKIQTVSVDILLQTLAKKPLAALKENNYHGQSTDKRHRIPASESTFTFAHGLEDEFFEVRRSACCALQTVTANSAEFANAVCQRVMDLLQDDSEAVRFQALETLHYMAIHNHLKVEESHMHMFFGALTDNSALIRSAARKTLKSTKLQGLSMFRFCIDVLIKNVELYPQDEAELFSVIFQAGQNHGMFVRIIIQEVSHELEPALGGKLCFSNVRTAALLVLAISAPVSFDRQVCSIPPQIYSYAVTLLGRISSGLIDVMDKNTLLAYMSHCSRFTFDSASKVFKSEGPDLHSKDSNVHLLEKESEIYSSSFPESMGMKNSTPFHDYQLKTHVEATSYTKNLFLKVVNLWPLMQLGLHSEVVQTLRNWKEELTRFTSNLNQPAGIVTFALKYLCVIKSLSNAWACYISISFNGIRVLEAHLNKTERVLKEMLHRFSGLNRENEIHILEMILITSTLRLLYGQTYCEDNMKKMQSILSRVECPGKLSDFVTELQKVSFESEDEFDILEKSIDLFSLRNFQFSGELKLVKAEMDFHENDFHNTIPFIPGLPVGLECEITLHNVSSESRLWLAMTSGESTQFVFLDLAEFGECNGVRKSSFIASFYRTPNVKCFSPSVCIVMECMSEVRCFKLWNGPKHQFVSLCKEKKLYLSTPRK